MTGLEAATSAADSHLTGSAPMAGPRPRAIIDLKGAVGTGAGLQMWRGRSSVASELRLRGPPAKVCGARAQCDSHEIPIFYIIKVDAEEGSGNLARKF